MITTIYTIFILITFLLLTFIKPRYFGLPVGDNYFDGLNVLWCSIGWPLFLIGWMITVIMTNRRIPSRIVRKDDNTVFILVNDNKYMTESGIQSKSTVTYDLKLFDKTNFIFYYN